MITINKEKAEQGAKMFMEGMGIPIDSNTKDAPRRMVKIWGNLCRGLYNPQELEDWAKITFQIGTYREIITQSPIEMFGICSHHLLPIRYKISFGYIPRERGIGFSKVGCMLENLAAVPATQEEFTEQAADVFNRLLDPVGLGLIVDGRHDCMEISRGFAFPNRTIAMRGTFVEPEVEERFFRIVKHA